jgi:hypothetical protein
LLNYVFGIVEIPYAGKHERLDRSLGFTPEPGQPFPGFDFGSFAHVVHDLMPHARTKC